MHQLASYAPHPFIVSAIYVFLTLKEYTYNWLLSFFLGRVAASVVCAGQILGRGLDSFAFHGFGHLYFSLILPFSLMFQGGACSWVCFGKRGCYNQGLASCFWGEQRPFSLLCCIYIPFKCGGVFGRLVTHVLIPIWFILGLVKSFMVPI